MRAMITPCTSNLLMDGRRQELPYLSDIIQFIVDYLQVCHLKFNVKPRTKVADGRTYKCHCCLTKI